MKSLVYCLTVCAVVWSAPAAGDDALTRARALYDTGAFDEAVEAAAAAGGAEGYALATRAAIADILFAGEAAAGDGEIERARQYGEAAVAADPSHVEARLQLSVTLWLQGRAMSGFESYVRRLPHQSLTLIEGALADAPDDPWANALLGAWHFEVVRRGGNGGARIFDASVAEGAAHFYRAMDLAPDDASIMTQCALAFLSVDADAYAEHARIVLMRARDAHADNAFEAEMQAHAAVLQQLLEADRREALAVEVARWTDG